MCWVWWGGRSARHTVGGKHHTASKVYNLKQIAAALQYLRENDLMDYEALAASTEKAVERFHTLSEELRQTEAEL